MTTLTRDNPYGLGVGYGGANPLGIQTIEQFEQFRKATQVSSYETNPLSMTGATAMRPESLEHTLISVIADTDAITLFKQLKRTPVKSAVHQWIRQTSLGGQLGAVANSEMGDINFELGEYERDLAKVKILSTGVSISHFLQVQDLVIDDISAQEQLNAVGRITLGAEIQSYHGDERVCPDQFNGFDAQLEIARPENIIDARSIGDVNELMREVIYFMKAKVKGLGLYGDLTHIHVDNFMQNALDASLFPSYRVAMDTNAKNLDYGSPVERIRTSHGTIDINQTIYSDNPENTMPKTVLFPQVPEHAPLAPTVVSTPQANVAGSLWEADEAGTYYIKVAGLSRSGAEGALSAAVSVTVTANGAISHAITRSGVGPVATGAAIYMSKKNPGSVPQDKDFRLVKKVPLTGANTVWVDLNLDVPGTSTIRAFNFKPTARAIGWAQLYPIFKFPLGTLTKMAYNWAVGMYGTLILTNPRTHFKVKNLKIADTQWKRTG